MWKNPRPNDFSPEGLRAIFKSIEDFLSDPTFDNGVAIGDGTLPTYDSATGVTTPAATTDVDADTFSGIDTDLTALQTDLDAAEADLTALEGRFPIQTVDIGDDQISTPKLQANSVTAAELAAINIAVGKWIASTSYSAGVSGWIIEADGSAEFNDVTVRGELAAGTLSGTLTVEDGGNIIVGESNPRIEITPDADGFGTPALWFYPSGGGTPALITLDGSSFNFTNASDDASVQLGSNAVDILTASGGTVTVQANSGTIDLDAPHVLLGDSGTDICTPTSYTPTNTAVTVGNGTQTAYYIRIGNLVYVSYNLDFGSTTTFTGTASIGLPFTAAAAAAFPGEYRQFGARSWVVNLALASGQSAALINHTESGNTGRVNGTNPFTVPASGSNLRFSGWYLV